MNDDELLSEITFAESSVLYYKSKSNLVDWQIAIDLQEWIDELSIETKKRGLR